MSAVVVMRVQLLPDVVDVTVILTGAGLGGSACMAVGAACRFNPDRLGRITRFGHLAGAAVTALVLVVALIAT